MNDRPCNCTACSEPLKFALRLASATQQVLPGVAIHIPRAQLNALVAKYGGVADERDRHFIVQSTMLGIGGAA